MGVRPVRSLSAQRAAATLPPGSRVDPIGVDVIVPARTSETFLADEPFRPPVLYPPADVANPTDRLTVRDLFWDEPVVIPRERWRFVMDSNGVPKLHLDDGFDPGRWYRVTYRPTRPVVAGVGLAAIRDAASAFRNRSDLPIRGRAAYVFGLSQTGRFLRQFLYDGFNVDERDRQVFAAVWVHIAGAARGSFNERFATPSHGDMFESTQFPFADADETDVDGSRDGLLSLSPGSASEGVYTNTPVGIGARASRGGDAYQRRRTRDLAATTSGTCCRAQHPGAFHRQPRQWSARRVGSGGRELTNPTHNATSRRLRAASVGRHRTPSPSRYPRIADGTPLFRTSSPALPEWRIRAASSDRRDGSRKRCASDLVPRSMDAMTSLVFTIPTPRCRWPRRPAGTFAATP
jgi:hypothetical protein